MLGLGAGIGTNWAKTVDVNFAYGTTVTRVSGEKWGAFTLGSYITGDKTIAADPNNSLFQHEYGHYLQSQAYGPMFLGKFAIPSLISAAKHNPDEHDAYKTEQDANVRALKFWEKKIPGFYKGREKTGRGWDQKHNPITDFQWEQPFDSDHNQQALRDGRMKGVGIADFIPFIVPFPLITLPTTGAMNY